VLFNLGLALDREATRPLTAAAWYRAYLAIAPDAVNAPQISRRVDELMVGVETSARRLIEAAEELALLTAKQDDLRNPTERDKWLAAAQRALARKPTADPFTFIELPQARDGLGHAAAASLLLGDAANARR
jgi:hypothetical protein